VASAAGAGLALLAATRTWRTEVVTRPAPLPPDHVAHTGAGQLPWLTALALVGLAGAGALLATRGAGRTIVGLLLLLAGLGVVGGGIDGLRLAAGGAHAWPVLAAVGGLAIAGAGLMAMRSGATWPAMGSRYERPAAPASATDAATGRPGGGSTGSRQAVSSRRRSDAAMWDELDRGVDPTADGDRH